MAVQRSATQLLSDIRTRVRRELGDPATDPAGTTISTQLLTWQDTDIDAAINDQLIEMGTISRLLSTGDALLYTDLTLTDDTTSPGIALPAGINSSAIFKVTDTTGTGLSASQPQKLQYLSPDEIENYGSPDLAGVIVGNVYYTIIATATGQAIIVRPLRTDHTIRIWYVAPPLTATASGDVVVFSETWREIIALGAAFKLLTVNGEAPDQLIVRMQLQAALFRSAVSRQADTVRIKRVAGLYRG